MGFAKKYQTLVINILRKLVNVLLATQVLNLSEKNVLLQKLLRSIQAKVYTLWILFALNGEIESVLNVLLVHIQEKQMEYVFKLIQTVKNIKKKEDALNAIEDINWMKINANFKHKWEKLIQPLTTLTVLNLAEKTTEYVSNVRMDHTWQKEVFVYYLSLLVKISIKLMDFVKTVILATH